MEWLATILLVVGAISNVSAVVLEALAERLLTTLLAVALIGGVSVFAVTGFTWLWLKRAIREPLEPRAVVPH